MLALMQIEIRAAEGGEDAKLLVEEMAGLYRAAARTRGFALS